MNNLLFLPFISIFYLVGFGLLGHSIHSAQHSLEASQWPSVPGTIIHLSLDESTDSDGDTTYGVEVKYTYQVMGQGYTGTRLAFGYVHSSGSQSHEEIFKKLKQASTVQVRYNPNDPSVSTLSYGIHRSIKFMLAFGVTWLAFVVGFTAIWWTASQPDDVLLKNLDVMPGSSLHQ